MLWLLPPPAPCLGRLSCCARYLPLPHLWRRFPTQSTAQEVNALNRLALEGVLAVIESISRRCGPSSQPPSSSSPPGGWARAGVSPPFPLSGPQSGGFSGSLGRPGSSRKSSASDSDSDQEYIAAFGGTGGGAGGGALLGRLGSEGDAPFGDGAVGAGELGWLERARARTAEVLQERKKMKRRLGLAARKFNSGSKGWLEYAQVSGACSGMFACRVASTLRHRQSTESIVCVCVCFIFWLVLEARFCSKYFRRTTPFLCRV